MKRASCALKSRFSKWKLKEEPGLKEPQGSRKQKLAQDLLVCSGLELFCKDFCQSLEHSLGLFAKFWELMQVLDAEWFEQEGGVLQTHVWALRMGLGAATPPVFRQLQKHVKAVKELVEKLRDHEEVLHARDKAWVEKEHYQRKLNELRSELTRRDQSGQAISAEQMERLRRNEAKNARAQDAYDGVHTQAQAYHAAKEDLKAVLCDVVRTVACGWFITVGAGVCRAVGEAESAQRGARGTRSTPTSSGLQALPGWPPQDSSSSSCTVEEVEELEPFDPADPFKGSWRCESVVVEEEESSDPGEAPPTATVWTQRRPARDGRPERAAEESEDEQRPSVEQLSEQALRQRLAECGLGVPPWCADRAALIELVKTLDFRGVQSPASTAGCRTPARKRADSGSLLGAGSPQRLEEVAAPPGPRFGAVAGRPSQGAVSPQAGRADEAECSDGAAAVLQGLSDSELREMLAASGLPASGALTRTELAERLLRSQSGGLG